MALDNTYDENPYAQPYPSTQGAATPAPAPASEPYTFDDAGLARLKKEHPEYSPYVDGLAAKGWQPQDIMGLTLGRDNQPQPLSQLSLSNFNSTNGAQTAQLGYGGTGGTGSSQDDLMGSIDPSYLTPFDKPFTLPSDATLPTYSGPGAFSYADFAAPTGKEITDDPGYQFRQDEGRKSVEAGASARGLLNSGGTLSDILKFGQSLASQEFSNVFDRKLTAYNTNRGNAADSYAKNYNTQFVDPYTFNTTRANTVRDRAQQDWLNERDTFYKNQQNPFDKLYSLSRLGFDSANA